MPPAQRRQPKPACNAPRLFICPVGMHKSEAVARIVIKDPSYVRWVLEQGNSLIGGLQAVQTEMYRLIGKFDARPFRVKCKGGCGNQATQASLCQGNALTRYWWCDSCNPYSLGAGRGTLTMVSGYCDALAFAAQKGDLEDLTRALAEAKGMPSYVSGKALEEFFA